MRREGCSPRLAPRDFPGWSRGTGYRLPFRDHAFDGTLFVHVLHMLDDPERAVREASRVGRVGSFALVHPRGGGQPDSARREDEPRHLVRAILEEEGYPMPPRSSPWTKERDLLARFPPDTLTVVSEREVTEPLRARIDRLSKRGHRNLLTIPPTCSPVPSISPASAWATGRSPTTVSRRSPLGRRLGGTCLPFRRASDPRKIGPAIRFA